MAWHGVHMVATDLYGVMWCGIVQQCMMDGRGLVWTASGFSAEKIKITKSPACVCVGGGRVPMAGDGG